MKRALAALTLATLTLAPLAASADRDHGRGKALAKGHDRKNPLANVPVRGEGVTGTVTIHGFMRQANGIVATGVFTGTVRDASGNLMTLPAEAFTAPVILPSPPGTITVLQTGPAEPGVCDILFLEIGPINLNLLGLVLDTQPIVIDLDAQPGPGNLLGNLLCGIVGLLDPLALFGVLDQLVTLLNQAVDILAGL